MKACLLFLKCSPPLPGINCLFWKPNPRLLKKDLLKIIFSSLDDLFAPEELRLQP